MEKQKQAYIYALSAILLWSTVAVAIKFALRGLEPLQMLFVATAVSLLTLAVILVARGETRKLRQTPRQLANSALLGLINPFGYYVVLFQAYKLLQAQIAQPLNYAWPVVLVILSVPILGHKLGLKSIIAILVSFTGVFFIASEGNIVNLKPSSPIGIALALGSSLLWALFWLFNARDKRDALVKLFYNFLFGLVFITGAMFFFSDFNMLTPKSLAAAAYLGVFEMGITFVLWLNAMQSTSSSDKIGNLVYLSPFISLVFIHFLLGERIYFTTFTGLVLIVAGIILQQYRPKKHRT